MGGEIKRGLGQGTVRLQLCEAGWSHLEQVRPAVAKRQGGPEDVKWKLLSVMGK